MRASAMKVVLREQRLLVFFGQWASWGNGRSFSLSVSHAWTKVSAQSDGTDDVGCEFDGCIDFIWWWYLRAPFLVSLIVFSIPFALLTKFGFACSFRKSSVLLFFSVACSFYYLSAASRLLECSSIDTFCIQFSAATLPPS